MQLLEICAHIEFAEIDQPEHEFEQLLSSFNRLLFALYPKLKSYQDQHLYLQLNLLNPQEVRKQLSEPVDDNTSSLQARVYLVVDDFTPSSMLIRKRKNFKENGFLATFPKADAYCSFEIGIAADFFWTKLHGRIALSELVNEILASLTQNKVSR